MKEGKIVVAYKQLIFFPMLNENRATVSHCSYAETQLKKYKEVVLDVKIFCKDIFALMIGTQYFAFL